LFFLSFFLFLSFFISSGEKSPKVITEFVGDLRRNHGITVSAFGIGADFDEALMTSIAEAGAGDYMFLKDRESIKELLDMSMQSLIGLVGTDARITISMPQNAKIQKVRRNKTKHTRNQMKNVNDE
jgi:Ca-activated chloride channel family protein